MTPDGREYSWAQLFRELDDIKEMLRQSSRRQGEHELHDTTRFEDVESRLNRIYGGIAVGALLATLVTSLIVKLF